MFWKKLSERIAWQIEFALINMTIQYRLLMKKYGGVDFDRKPFSEIPEGVIQLHSGEILNERSLSHIGSFTIIPDSGARITLELECSAKLREDWLEKLWFQVLTEKSRTSPIFYIVESVEIDDLKCTLAIIPYSGYWLRKAKKAIKCAESITIIRIISPDKENRTRIYYHEHSGLFNPADRPQ